MNADKKYFITLGLKALQYETLRDAEEAKARFAPIYPQFIIQIFEGVAVNG